MRGFAGAIAKVNGITLHHASITGNVSFAEFTFDFDMKDENKILMARNSSFCLGKWFGSRRTIF